MNARPNRLATVCGALMLAAVGAGCAQPADPFPEPTLIVDATRLATVITAEHGAQTFGPIDLDRVRTDYGSCADGLGGSLRGLTEANAATGSAVVTDQRAEGTVAEVVTLVARLPHGAPDRLVADGRAGCGVEPAAVVPLDLDGVPAHAVRFDGGAADDPLGVLVSTSRVDQDLVVVLVAFNGAQPAEEVRTVLSLAHHDAVGLLDRG